MWVGIITQVVLHEGSNGMRVGGSLPLAGRRGTVTVNVLRDYVMNAIFHTATRS